MSSLAPAPEAAALRARRAGQPSRGRVTGDSLLGLAIAAGLSVLAFTTTGGSALLPDGANTVSQIVLLAIAAGLGVAVVIRGARGRAWGVWPLGLFAALGALSYASIAWSVQPAISWLEANRTLSYLAAFAAAAALARLRPARWRGLLLGIAGYSLIISGWALLTKVFPASLDPNDALGRLGVPFSYYNATGLVAAIGVPAWLWLGAAGPSRRAATAVSVPALAVVLCTLILSYGRGALGAALVGLALWFLLAPVRLRGALVLGLSAVGGVGVSLWATGQTALSQDYVALHLRTSAGHRLGWILLVALIVLAAVGVAVALGSPRVRLTAPLRRRIGIGLIACLCLVPVAGVVAMAASSRGLGGEVSHLWHSLTSPSSAVSDSPSRLSQLGSSRPRYWRDGLRVGAHSPVAGTGALGFYTAEWRYSPDTVTHAHSYVIETFADFGAIGLLISAALLVGWAVAVRTVLRRVGDEEPGAGVDERIGLVTVLAVAVIFGVHSAVDWTWFIPGVAVPGMLCAGWLAGRGPLGSPVGALAKARSLLGEPLRGGTALGLVALALAAAWVVWLPQRAQDADNSALAEILRGNGAGALTDARTAASSDPVDISPHVLLSSILGAVGETAQARDELVKATSLQPDNPASWAQLAAYDRRHGHAADAARDQARERALDPYHHLKF